MSENANLALVVSLFLVAFPLLWLFVTTLLRRLSGWPALEQRFPDTGEPALRTLRFQSGRMGKVLWTGVNYNGCLTLGICRGGLRVKVMRIFAPFGSPILVPWAEIAPSATKILFFRYVRLGFGRPREIGSLTLARRTFSRIAGEGFIAEP